MLLYTGACTLSFHAQLFIVNKIRTLFCSAVFYTWFVYDSSSGEYDPALSVFLEVGIAAKVL